MPLMVTRPVIDRIASVTRVRWRSVVASRHWLRQAQTIIMSGMGGFSSCELGLGCPYSTRSSTALPHTHFGEGIGEKDTIIVRRLADIVDQCDRRRRELARRSRLHVNTVC